MEKIKHAKAYNNYNNIVKDNRIDGYFYNKYIAELLELKQFIGIDIFYFIYIILDKKYLKTALIGNRKKHRIRNEATRYTSKKHIKEFIFGMHGYYCLKCGSKSNITLDHIIPIIRGGCNSTDNLQPLCQSCNSSKGSKIIDYRGEQP